MNRNGRKKRVRNSIQCILASVIHDFPDDRCWNCISFQEFLTHLEKKSQEDILNIFSGKNKIFIVGCGDCAATCKTGGVDDVKVMAEFLISRGKEITGVVVPDVTCVSAQTKVAFVKNKKALKNSDSMLVLACGSGVQCVQENDRFDLSVYSGCDSLFAAVIDKNNAFKEVCRMCGECVLDKTAGICPVARCAKGLMNGPCGGQNKGKCETDREKDCAWIVIYERLKQRGELDKLRKRQTAKDRSKALQ